MNLSEHFTLEEAIRSDTATRKGLDNSPSAEVLANMMEAAEQLEVVRRLLDAPIQVTSWYRSPKLNTLIGGSATGAHPEGWAIDFRAPGFGTPLEVCRAVRDSGIKFDQLIYEGAGSGAWVHISFAPRMRQQVLTAAFKANGVSYTAGIS